MGSPLACLLANLYMDYFETELRLTLEDQPCFWYRFIDDIITAWPHGEEKFKEFLTKLNGLEESINLTSEWEVTNDTGVATLPFLDVLIHRTPDEVTFSVYRKPTHSNAYIHYFSHHAPAVKKGVLSGLFLRALRICSKPHLQTELDTLWTVFKQLGYPDFFIKQAVLSVRCTFHASKSSTPAPPTPSDLSGRQDPNSTFPISTIPIPANLHFGTFTHYSIPDTIAYSEY